MKHEPIPCPYCGKDEGVEDWDEYFSDHYEAELECNNCGKLFIISRIAPKFEYTYSIRKVEQ